MAKQYSRLLIEMIAGLFLASFFSACSAFSVQNNPTATEMEDFFQVHQEDFEIIVNYLLTDDHTYILIDDATGTMLTGTAVSPLSETVIADEDALSRLQLLFQKGCKSITKDLDNNLISFEFWRKPISSVSKGIVYAVRSNAEPNVEFLTELKSFIEDGWYYYVSDYEQWRIDVKGQ